MTEKKLCTDAVVWAYNEFIGDDPAKVARFELVRAQSALARSVYNSRKKLQMSREDLAKRSGLTLQTIEDIEESDYDGDWNDAIQRINGAFTTWVTEVLVPTYKKEKPKQPWDYNKAELAALLEIMHQKAIEADSSARIA